MTLLKTAYRGMMFIPLWRGNIYKTQSNLEVSQSIRLFFNYLGMTQLMSGGGIIIVAQTVIPQLSTLFS